MNPQSTSIAELLASVDSAWQNLHSFLAALSPSQASVRDHAGWSVKDHVTHLAVWEDSVTVLFRGGGRHEALGIDESVYSAGAFDDINDAIKKRLEAIPLAQAVHQLEQGHTQLVASLSTLSDADLKSNVRDFFPTAPRTDERPLTSLIWDNTGGHFVEHLEWMRELASRGA
ncbi:MAG TPA: DinB family protein [Anaerolineales bacterium]|nr:DinB family protein [Anaerolineales bacterium]